MDIKMPLPADSLAIAKGNTSSLLLKLNQLLDVKVIKAKKNQTTVALQLSDKTIHVQGNRPLKVSDGQSMRLQVVKLQPVPEFKIVNLTAQQSESTITTSTQKQTTEIILRLVSAQLNNNIQTQALSQLVTGQHLQLKLTDVTGKRLTGLFVPHPLATESNQSITLNNSQISNLPMTKAGQIITLQVTNPGSPPQFKMVDSNPVDVIVEAIKRYLPIQESHAASFSQLIKQLTELETNEKIPDTLKRLAQEILKNLPQRSQITNAEMLKQQILNSGRFLETKLAQLINNSEIVLQDDLKLKLLKLIKSLKQQTQPKAEQKLQSSELNLFREILQKSNGSLARITLDQLNSLPREEGNKQTWLLELPFLNNDETEKVSIEIERDQESDNPEQKNNWSVSITITPPELGTIHCKLSCYNSVVSTQFWSEHPSTIVKINSHLNYLKQQLEQNGINPGMMDVKQGKPEASRQQKFLGQNLLSEEA